jgi:hypothetical protein
MPGAGTVVRQFVLAKARLIRALSFGAWQRTDRRIGERSGIGTLGPASSGARARDGDPGEPTAQPSDVGMAAGYQETQLDEAILLQALPASGQPAEAETEEAPTEAKQEARQKAFGR